MKYTASKKTKPLIPGFGLTLGITLTMLSLLILIPLASVLVYGLSLSPGEFWDTITSDNVRNAFLTSILCSLCAALINAFFGTLLAWTLVRYDFFFKRFLDGLIELPFAFPTAVAGITLSRMYSSTGFPGQWLDKLGIRVSYTHSGIVLALVFVGIPFVVRTVQPVLEQLDTKYEEAALSLGANSPQIFFRVIFPEILPAVLTGFGLAFARGIGEYGSVIYISGNSVKEHTQVISYVIMQKLNYLDYSGAAAVALAALLLSFLMLLLLNIVQIRKARRTEKA